MLEYEAKVGTRVRFIGPEYRWSRLNVGEMGTVLESPTGTCNLPGEKPEPLALVAFDGHKKAAHVCLRRLEAV